MMIETPKKQRHGNGDGQWSDDERASEWVDALMDERQREEFERELADDPALAEELKKFEQTVNVLRSLPQADAPDDFLQAVQSRIRRRSRGRWFGFDQGKTRFPYEATFNIVLIGILFALYLSSSTWGPAKLVEPRFNDAPAKKVQRALPQAAAIGAPRIIENNAGGTVLEVVVDSASGAAVLNEAKKVIAENAGLELLAERPGADGKTVLRLRLRGPPAGGK